MQRDKKYDTGYLAINYHFGDWDNSYRPGGPGNLEPLGGRGSPPYPHVNGGPHSTQKKLYTSFYGTKHDDSFTTSDYGQAFFGGAGNDVLHATPNTTDGVFFLGGLGIDTADFSKASRMVNLNLAGTKHDTLRLEEVENIIGTRFGDRLQGDNNNNILNGNAGDDVLIGGRGADTLIGGEGRDTVSYVNASGGINVDLQNYFSIDNEGNRDTLVGIENIQGSNRSDKIYGDRSNNFFSGNDGNDVLVGLRGDDILWGMAGDDLLVGAVGNDVLQGGEGRDTLSGGANTDILTGGADSDTFIFVSLAGVDRITDFQIGVGGDKLNLHSILSQTPYNNGDAGDIHEFLRLITIGGESHLQLDPNGALRPGAGWQDVVILEHLPNIHLDTLLANGQLQT